MECFVVIAEAIKIYQRILWICRQFLLEHPFVRAFCSRISVILYLDFWGIAEQAALPSQCFPVSLPFVNVQVLFDTTSLTRRNNRLPTRNTDTGRNFKICTESKLNDNDWVKYASIANVVCIFVQYITHNFDSDYPHYLLSNRSTRTQDSICFYSSSRRCWQSSHV